MTLVVFDFDWTLFNNNTDTLIVKELGDAALLNRQNEYGVHHKSKTDGCWTDLMDSLFEELHSRLGIRDHHIAELFARQRVDSSLAEAIRTLRRAHNCTFAIISDSNTHFIDWILNSNNLADCFEHVVTNPSQVNGDGRLRVEYRQARETPHRCDTPCSPNLCKGLEISTLIESLKPSKVVYCGDGKNDFCAAKRLVADRGDLVLARRDWGLHQRCESRGIDAELRLWTNGGEMAAALLAECGV